MLSGEECFIETLKPVIELPECGLMPKTESRMQIYIYIKQSIDRNIT